MLQKNNSFQFFFGDSFTSIDSIKERPAAPQSLRSAAPYTHLYQQFNLDHLTFLRQIHSTKGYIIHSANDSIVKNPYMHEGDFLVTNQPRLGIGVATADCLPLIFFDTSITTVAVAHAGWRGSLDHIATRVIDALLSLGGCVDTMQVFFGPSAKVCCYQVDQNFVAALNQSPHQSQVIQERHGKLFFDLPRFNQLELQTKGLSPLACNFTHNHCTICSPLYCSYRRQKEAAKRQLTFVFLV